MIHHFNIQVAEKLGVNAAIMAANVQFWCAKNEANESKKHFHAGRYWTYNSVAALDKLFPYLTREQIRYALKKCVDDGLLVSGNFNREKRDRTKWYSYNGEQWWTEQSKLHLGNFPNDIGPHSQMPFGNIPKPLPDTNPDNKPNNKPSAHECASLPCEGAARLRALLVSHGNTGSEARAVNRLLNEAEAFDGRRILVSSRFMADRLSMDLSDLLKAKNLIITTNANQMQLEDKAA